ncbi:response regulator transcription factor [Kribbella sp. NPDC055071]
MTQALHISPGTAKTHIGNLRTKLQVRDRAQLVIAAYDHHLVTPTLPPKGRSAVPPSPTVKTRDRVLAVGPSLPVRRLMHLLRAGGV